MRWSALALALIAWVAPMHAWAGAWTTPEGKMWTKVAWIYLDSDRLFVDSEREGLICGDGTLRLGERGPYDCQLGGGFKASSLLIESSIGIHSRFDVKVQIPIFISAQFLATGTFQQRRGLGDIRFTAQGVLLEAPVVLAASVEVKAPTGFFTQDAVGVPLGEGQWDIAFRALASYPFAKGFAWTGVEAGYRIRLANDQLGIGGLDLGDEILATYELGGRFPKARWLYLSGRYDLRYQLESKDLSQDVFVPNRPVRAVMYVTPKLIINPFARQADAINRLGIEVEVLLPVWGRGWPADPIWVLALTGLFRLFPEYSGKQRRPKVGQPPPAPAPDPDYD